MAAPLAGTQAPAFYRHKVGSYEVTVISDGNLTLDATMFTGDEAGAEKLLRDAHLPKTGFITPINVWLINTGQKLILVDAGGGTHFAPSIGRLPQNLAAAGISPAAIDADVITHPHPDHIPGVITSDHKMLFPNATLHVNENDHSFWTSADIRGKAPEEFRGFFDLAVNAIKPYAAAGKLSLYKDGIEFAPGVRAAACYGHTVGHSMVRVSPPGGDFLIFGDIVHCLALQFPDPERSVGFDTDGPAALANRKRVLDMVTTDRLLFSGGHLPFPALGHATRSGSGYAFVPVVHNSEV